jgi:hypothetical protein
MARHSPAIQSLNPLQRKPQPKTPKGKPTNPATSMPTGRTVFGTLTILAGLVFLGWALWEQQHYTGSRPARELPTFCAWCVWRGGEDCTNPAAQSVPNPAAQCASVLGRSLSFEALSFQK